MSFFKKIWEWIKSLFGGDKDKAIKLGDKVFMPLFYNYTSVSALEEAVFKQSYIYNKYFKAAATNIRATWDYMNKNEAERKFLRDFIKANAVNGETPAMTWCLSPYGVNGNTIPDNMSSVSVDALNVIEARCKEAVKDGIAVFLCLYVDDAVPRWFEIEKHKAVWKKVHDRVGYLVTGYVLSIETNEYANNVGHIEGCINVMRSVMSGVDHYTTHLQFAAKNSHGYEWIGSTNKSTPKNITMLLVEMSWDPHKGDAVGVQGVKNEYAAIKQREPSLRLIVHEYNINSMSATGKAQREWLRTQSPFGVA